MELESVWGIAQPITSNSPKQGILNQTQLIDTPAGSYVLREYSSASMLSHIEYEIAVLTGLENLSLPFRVPVPLLTLNGERLTVIDGVVFTLSPLLPGVHPQADNLQHTFAAGKALAQLVDALGQLDIGGSPMPTFGNLEVWADGAPLAVIRQIAPDDQSQISDLGNDIQTTVPQLYAALPHQITHRDYDAFNVLFEGDQLTGVLDFEFCAPDLRVIDFAFALSQWAWEDWDKTEAFGRGYASHHKLTIEEINAIPQLYRLRAVATLYQRIGRYQRGLLSEAGLLKRVQDTLKVDRWVRENGEALRSMAQQWHV